MRNRRTYGEILNSRSIPFKIDNNTWDKAGEILKLYGLTRQNYLRFILKTLVEKGEPNPDFINTVK